LFKVLAVFFFVLFNLEARENPFFPSQGELDLPHTSNTNKSTPVLKRAAITLPSSAREITKLTVTYKNLDGSIKEKSIELNHTIDWHLPLFISQNIGNASNQTKKKTVKKPHFQKLLDTKYIDFFHSGKVIKVVSNDKLMRHFLLTNPHKIVIDFKRDVHLKSINKNFKGIVKNIKVGTHKGYYRAVIELDGYYQYKIKKIASGYQFNLH
jgi:hypothetical protein